MAARQGIGRWAGLVFSLALCAQAASAQDSAAPAASLASPILTLDQDALFARSKFGQALRARLNAETSKAEAEARRLDSEAEAEERALTDQRATMTPEQFAPLAAAFDAKVQRLRDERDAVAADLQAQEAAARQQFTAAAVQVIRDYLVERGAVAIIDKNAIIAQLTSLDVTDAVVAKLDAVLGDGSAIPAP